ncbi:Ig-like domain-containing protein [Tautonia sociabilis]|uniref:Surface layer protein bacterial Ig-like domain-containing protein n=1 Tax=Tautonia sociabilis TaxID=2080755 RepID=A0A432MJN0_9BACT|nr:hypothetical protein [Tautonia sociabilis]RUL87326.1 hypothetical protein TsocGM_13205 [Tautonia sociabilis]
MTSRRPSGTLLALTLLLAVAIPPGAAQARDGLALLPPSATLDGSRASQRFLVERLGDDGSFAGDLAGGVAFSVSIPNIARVSADGIVTPVSDGVTTLRATVGEQSIEAIVTVVGSSRAEPWSFRNHVLPVLTKTGCNQGSCHGAAAGKTFPEEVDAFLTDPDPDKRSKLVDRLLGSEAFVDS